MNRKFLVAGFLVLASALFLISSCKKDTTSEPLEPITIVKPDSSIVYYFPSDSIPMQFKFTTDRPINWIKGMYDLDTTGATNYVPTYTDTLFFAKLDTLSPRVNRYDYSVTYFVPDTLYPFDQIRFRVSFEAGSSTFSTGQNYPAGKVSATKEFRVDVR
jgi:hypothetical protein